MRSSLSGTIFKSLLVIAWVEFENEDSNDSTDMESSYSTQTFSLKFVCQVSNNETASRTIHVSKGTDESNSTKQRQPAEKVLMAIGRVLNQQDISHQKDENYTALPLNDVCYKIHNSDIVSTNKNLVIENTTTVVYLEEAEKDSRVLKNSSSHFIVEYRSNEKISSKDIIQVLCLTSNSFYPYGGHVKINRQNGSSEVLGEVEKLLNDTRFLVLKERENEHELFDKEEMEYLSEVLAITNTFYYLSKPFRAEADMQSVECVMPLWTDAENAWESVVKNITVETQ